eukprot:TRINITY_DN25073_c0_g1_i1.p1 TRINITY_DN25073_c0_g1~~TRINITY_DN25073_c0_g1_i1.p1  ORF type:complete len:404 (+),score=34.57 TRINITY_DN25073_c0_g1_i1:40-1251(+)
MFARVGCSQGSGAWSSSQRPISCSRKEAAFYHLIMPPRVMRRSASSSANHAASRGETARKRLARAAATIRRPAASVRSRKSARRVCFRSCTVADMVQRGLASLPQEVQQCIGRFLVKPKYIKAAAGLEHFVLIRDDGVAKAGGGNVDGECDIPAPPPGVHYTDVFAGSYFTVLIRSDGQATFVGRWPCDHDIGNPWPCSPPAGLRYVGGAAGRDHGVLIRSDGSAVGFGMNHKRDGSTLGCSDVPVLPEGTWYVSAAAGYRHTILIRSDGEAVCCGQSPHAPFEIPFLSEGLRYVAAAVGFAFTALLRSDGCAVGIGPHFLFGIVELRPRAAPWTGISAGWGHVSFLRSDGRVDSFGAYFPHPCEDDVRYVAVESGAHFTILLRSDGGAVICGLGGHTIQAET